MEQAELLKLQTNAPQHGNKENYSSKRIELPLTPYYIVGNSEEGYCLTLGKYKISEQFSQGTTEENELLNEAYDHLEENRWNITFHTICAIKEMPTRTTDTNK